MMVVCVEAGLGLDQAMRKVSEEMKKAYPMLAAEFDLTNFHLQMGKSRGPSACTTWACGPAWPTCARWPPC